MISFMEPHLTAKVGRGLVQCVNFFCTWPGILPDQRYHRIRTHHHIIELSYLTCNAVENSTCMTQACELQSVSESLW